MEELVDSVSRLTSHSERRGEQISSGAQVSLFAQELNGMALGLEGVFGCRRTLNLYPCCLYLKGLLHVGSKLNYTLDNKSRADILVSDLVVIVYFFAFKYHLNVFMTASVVEVDKTECLAIAEIAHPTAKNYRFTTEFLGIFINRAYKISFHIISPSVIYNITIYYITI